MNKTNLLSEGDGWLVKPRARAHTHTHTHTHTHSVSTYSRHSVTNEHVDSHAHTTTLAHIASTSIPHSLHLSVSVTTRGLYSGIPYTAVAKKCSLEKLYSKRKHNHSSPSVSLLPCSFFSTFSLFPHTFPSSGFFSSGAAADGALR